MAFWIAVAFICAVVAGLVLWAALRFPVQTAPTSAYDLPVDRDRLRDLNRSVSRGTLTEEETAHALHQARGASGTARVGLGLGLGLVAGGVIAAVSGSLWLYSQTGAPGAPDLLSTDRIAMVESAGAGAEAGANRLTQASAEDQLGALPAPAASADRLAMVEQLRTVLERRPDDTRGLALLAANEAMVGNFIAARRAQQRLIDLLGDDVTARHHIDQAEMMIFAAGGYVSPEAEDALRAGLTLEPRDGTGRFYAGEMYVQRGRPDLALPIWSDLLRDSDADAPWVPAIRARIRGVATAAGVDPDPDLDLDPAPAAAARGPQPSDMEGLSEDDRQAMIETMVAGLADRLASDGGTPRDWAQLVTAYGVLGRATAARTAYDDALVRFADAPEALAIVEEAFRAAMARTGAQ